jgi:hypothetical protein
MLPVRSHRSQLSASSRVNEGCPCNLVPSMDVHTGSFAKSLDLLTAAIRSCRPLLETAHASAPAEAKHLLSVLYCNRAAVHAEQGSWVQAKVDAKLAIQQVYWDACMHGTYVHISCAFWTSRYDMQLSRVRQ